MTRSQIVVGVDGSETSAQALRWADFLARTTASSLEAVMVWQLPAIWNAGASAAVAPFWHPADDARKALEESVQKAFGGEPPAGIKLTVREGNPANVLIDISSSALMLIVGRRGHGGFTGLLLGSVSAACAEHGNCPVLVVHGNDEPIQLTASS